MSKASKEKKIGLIIVGDSNVGKSSLFEVLTENTFATMYEPSVGIEKGKFVFETDRGVEGVFRLYDVGDLTIDPENTEINREWPKKNRVQCAILMFDVTSIPSYKNIPDWYQKINDKYPGILMVLCGNKADSKDRKVRPKFITHHKKYNIPYYDISAKTVFNIDKPFMYFVNRLAERKKDKEEMKRQKP